MLVHRLLDERSIKEEEREVKDEGISVGSLVGGRDGTDPIILLTPRAKHRTDNACNP